MPIKIKTTNTTIASVILNPHKDITKADAINTL